MLSHNTKNSMKAIIVNAMVNRNENLLIDVDSYIGGNTNAVIDVEEGLFLTNLFFFSKFNVYTNTCCVAFPRL